MPATGVQRVDLQRDDLQGRTGHITFDRDVLRRGDRGGGDFRGGGRREARDDAVADSHEHPMVR